MKNAFLVWDRAFSEAELDAIERYGDQMILQKAVVAVPSSNDDDLRITQIAWLERNAETSALYERVTQIVRKLNDEIYHFDVTDLERIQYTVYHSGERGHYDWHIDHGPQNPKPRKISMSLQLTEPSQYQGCDLQFQVSRKVASAPRTRGTLIAFPSFFLHRVTPVVAGTRKALVIWVTGPAFR